MPDFLEYMRSFQVWQQADTQLNLHLVLTLLAARQSVCDPQEILLPLFSSNEVSPCKTSHEPVERANVISQRYCESINRSGIG